MTGNKRRLSLLGLAGLLLLAAGLAGLLRGPEVSQYAFAPAKMDILEKMEKAEESLEGLYPALSLHGMRGDQPLSTDRKSQAGVTLYQVSGEWQQVYPQVFLAGRPISRGDGDNRVIVLDEETAFQLFGDQDSLGGQVKIGENLFEVIGVVRHARRIGERDARAAWIPLGALEMTENEILIFSAGGRSVSGGMTLFETASRDLFGEGQAFHLWKERLRGLILPGAALLVIALRLLAGWVRFARKKSARWLSEIRGRFQTRYPRQMVGYTLVRLLGMGGLFGLAIILGAGLALGARQVMLAFPEWIPEVLVDPAALTQRFWNLTALSARPNAWRTPEVAEIRFWSGVIRWGLVLCLLGAVPKSGIAKGKNL